jgi:hypothetical protein
MLNDKKISEILERHPSADNTAKKILIELLKTTDRALFTELLGTLKVALACSDCGQNGAGHKRAKYARRGLQFAHLDRQTKTRTKSGKSIHPSRLLSDGYSLAVVVEQCLFLSRVLCAFCHALETAEEEDTARG